jgi:hypothetical protein
LKLSDAISPFLSEFGNDSLLSRRSRSNDEGMAYSGSASDRLNAVRQAIDACLSSQQYTVRGRSQQMAQLRDLRQLEKDLMEEVNQEAGGSSMASLGIQVRPR